MSGLWSDLLRKCYSVKNCQNLDQLSDVTHEYLKEDIQRKESVQLGYHYIPDTVSPSWRQ